MTSAFLPFQTQSVASSSGVKPKRKRAGSIEAEDAAAKVSVALVWLVMYLSLPLHYRSSDVSSPIQQSTFTNMHSTSALVPCISTSPALDSLILLK